MFTEEPKTVPALMNQISRWNAGFHQGLYLQGKEFRRKNPRIAFTLYGAKYEGMAAAGFLAAMPTLTASYMLTGFGLPPIALGIFAASDLAIQGSLLGVANYKKHRILGKNKKDAFKTGVTEAAQNILPLYGLRIANAFQFVKTYVQTQWDGTVKKVRCWNSEWERPHKL
ncbi:hypothetical protein GOV10_00905 [Candidatus Woesearchaeota archaeon]|nr:hypothetical protein [Candidatus Woesearchaeota archaeon]